MIWGNKRRSGARIRHRSRCHSRSTLCFSSCSRVVRPGRTNQEKKLIVTITILASGSSGNATLIATPDTCILFDVGISRREFYRRMAEAELDAGQIDGVVVSHEHSDHVCGLVNLLKHQQAQRGRALPAYMNARTCAAIDWKEFAPGLECIDAGTSFRIGDFGITTFTIPHDASDPVGFLVDVQGHRIGLLTDLGYVPESVRFHMRDVEFLLLESNHDLEMLKVGPYPWSVKQRVMGRNGHLSNDSAADFVAGNFGLELRTLVLGHLSENNNHPSVARLTMQNALQRSGLAPVLEVVERRSPVARFELP